mmetsp:Transcript_14047/g.44125  ORF Transcript_14047/g.44125 Transcript_14047/m.44125 type:complete len:374 (-) Transcript_14047:378-1499(-)
MAATLGEAPAVRVHSAQVPLGDVLVHFPALVLDVVGVVGVDLDDLAHGELLPGVPVDCPGGDDSLAFRDHAAVHVEVALRVHGPKGPRRHVLVVGAVVKVDLVGGVIVDSVDPPCDEAVLVVAVLGPSGRHGVPRPDARVLCPGVLDLGKRPLGHVVVRRSLLESNDVGPIVVDVPANAGLEVHGVFAATRVGAAPVCVVFLVDVAVPALVNVAGEGVGVHLQLLAAGAAVGRAFLQLAAAVGCVLMRALGIEAVVGRVLYGLPAGAGLQLLAERLRLATALHVVHRAVLLQAQLVLGVELLRDLPLHVLAVGAVHRRARARPDELHGVVVVVRARARSELPVAPLFRVRHMDGQVVGQLDPLVELLVLEVHL